MIKDKNFRHELSPVYLPLFVTIHPDGLNRRYEIKTVDAIACLLADSFGRADRSLSSVHDIVTRPDTRQSSRGRLGRINDAKCARNSKIFRTDGPTDGPTRQGVETRVRD